MKKKICMVVTSPLTIISFQLGQITALAKEYDLTIITNTSEPDFLSHLGVPHRVLPVGIERAVAPWSDLKVFLRLVALFFKEQFDLVHSVSPKSGLLAMAAAWIVRTPLRIHTFQGEVWVTRKGLWRVLLKYLDKLVARWATHLLVVSDSEATFLAQHGILPHGKGQVLAQGSICGVDTDRFRPNATFRERVRTRMAISETATVLLFLGRLTVDKGVLDLASAFSRIVPRHADTHLLIVGPDEENLREEIMHRCEQGKPRVHFVNYTDEPEQYMAAADMVCLPSYREGFGLVLIEAAAAGIPSIGSRIYGITDAIAERETGLLFTAGKIDELAGKIESLLCNPQLRAQLGRNGRERALACFSKEYVLAALMGFYEKILASERTRGRAIVSTAQRFMVK